MLLSPIEPNFVDVRRRLKAFFNHVPRAHGQEPETLQLQVPTDLNIKERTSGGRLSRFAMFFCNFGLGVL